MADPLTSEELRVLAHWQFPCRLNQVLDATMSYQRSRQALGQALVLADEERQVQELLAGELRDQLHPAHRELIEQTLASAGEAQAAFLAASSELERRTVEWTETVGDQNAFGLIEWLEEQEWAAQIEKLKEFIVTAAPSTSA